ncbi:Hsp70 family protein [Micromonospora mirobrigensis]|uniref:PQQ-like domain-containing protein n=1 Tax=Micromonospora mirobrigensis TaxID=262898 RepID=A0A1C4XE98_9ACTN|nr:Hsp70 family protein [Micromonospora mirobrigensis]SCF06873.1 PQQ-like domain-containing protein [Micromonospora mirobrigensis]
MVGQHDGSALGVDLGTSNTVAVLRWPDGRTRPLLFDGQPILPSGVYADAGGVLHVGRDAQRLGQAEPQRYEPNPKRRVDEATVALGDREYSPAELLAATLRAVAASAVGAVGFLPPAVLTYPAAWDEDRRQVLHDALRLAGWPDAAEHTLSGPVPPGTRLLKEPVAAARYYTETLRRPVPVGAAIAVFDFGGGTLDVAVVRNEGADPWGDSGFQVVSTGGVPDLGGLDLDSALVELLGELVGADHPQEWERLSSPENSTGRRDRQQLWEAVRGAKEMLSRGLVSPVAVPGVEEPTQLTRNDLERLATPLLARAVDRTREVIAEAGLEPTDLAGLFLVGGSSRVPLVARMLHAELGVAPTVLEQPELPVAEGALTDVPLPRGARPAGQAATGSPAVRPARTPTPTPVDDDPELTVPVIGPPVLPPGAGWPGVPAAAPAGRRRRRAPWIALGAVLALAGVVGAGVLYWLNRDPYPPLRFRNLNEIARTEAAATRPTGMFTAMFDDRAYLAQQLDDDRLDVRAVRAGTGDELWRVRSSVGARQWASIQAVPGGLLLVGGTVSSGSTRELLFLDGDSGQQRWRHPIGDDDKVFVGPRTAVWVDRAGGRLVGLGVHDGEQKWVKANPRDRYGDTDTQVVVLSTGKSLGGASFYNGRPRTPWVGDVDRLVQVGADRSVRLIDLSSGQLLRERPNVADVDDRVVAYQDRLYVTENRSGYRLLSYDLETLGEPTTLYTSPDDQRRPLDLVACGEHRACVLEERTGDAGHTEVVAAAEGEAVRRWAAPRAEDLVPLGEHLLARSTSSDQSFTLYDPRGRAVLADRTGVGVRVDGGNLLAFAEPPSTVEDDRSVAGMSVDGDAPFEMGQLTDVRSESCSWNSEVIACGAEKNFVLYRFAD